MALSRFERESHSGYRFSMQSVNIKQKPDDSNLPSGFQDCLVGICS